MKHVHTHNENSDFVIAHGGYSFVYVRNFEIPPIEELTKHNAVVVEVKNLDFVRLVIDAIRANQNPEIYLIPIFLLKKDSLEDVPYIEELVDGSIKSLDDLDFISKEVERIEAHKKNITPINSISFEAQVITKLISLMYVREQKELAPVPDAYSNMNYSFPYLSVNFDKNEEHTVLSILDIAEDEGMLRSEYHDRVYLCSSCSGSHLSYREVVQNAVAQIPHQMI